MSDKPPLDLSESEWRIVRNILHTIVPDHQVWAFGSRVTHKAKPFSDLDLAVIGQTPLPLATSAALSDAFAASDLAWKVDVVDWATTSENFRRIINRHKVMVQGPGEVGQARP